MSKSKIYILFITALLLLMAACGNDDAAEDESQDQSPAGDETEVTEDKEAEEDVHPEDSTSEENSSTENDEEDPSNDTRASETESAEADEPEFTSASGGELDDSRKTAYLVKLTDLEDEMAEIQMNSEATTTYEMEEEATERLQAWDDALNELYADLREELPADAFESLKEEQRNWIKTRDEQAKDASLKVENGSMQAIEYIAVQADLTKFRCYELVNEYIS